jgi:hypothetical protein
VEEPESAAVPIVGVYWLCFPGRAPRVAGTLPSWSGRAWFTAADLHPSADLTAFVARDVVFQTRPAKSKRNLVLRVAHANIDGLPAWGRVGNPVRRVIAVGVSLFLLSLASAWSVLRWQLRQGWLAVIVGASPALLVLKFLHADDPVSVGGAVAAAVVCALTLGVLLGPAVRRARNRLTLRPQNRHL